MGPWSDTDDRCSCEAVPFWCLCALAVSGMLRTLAVRCPVRLRPPSEWSARGLIVYYAAGQHSGNQSKPCHEQRIVTWSVECILRSGSEAHRQVFRCRSGSPLLYGMAWSLSRFFVSRHELPGRLCISADPVSTRTCVFFPSRIV